MADIWRTSGFKQINAVLTAGAASQTIYEPENGVDGSGNPLPFWGQLDTLRIKISLPSMPARELAEGFDDLEGIAQRSALRDLMYGEFHKIFKLEMWTPRAANPSQWDITTPCEVGIINRDPFYHFSLMTFLTDAAVFPLGPETRLVAKVEESGWGGLVGEDRVEVWGNVRTEAFTFSQPPVVVNVTGGSGGGSTGSGELPANAVLHNGEPVNLGSDLVTFGA